MCIFDGKRACIWPLVQIDSFFSFVVLFRNRKYPLSTHSRLFFQLILLCCWFMITFRLFFCSTFVTRTQHTFHGQSIWCSIVLYGQFKIKLKLMHKRKINFESQTDRKKERERNCFYIDIHRETQSDKWDSWREKKRITSNNDNHTNLKHWCLHIWC